DKEAIGNLMIRFGLSKKTELRLVSDFGISNYNDNLNTIGISFKRKLLEQNKIIPEITLVGYYRNLIKNKIEFQKQENYALILAFQNILSEKLTIGYNFGTNSFGESIIVTLFSNYIFSKKITFYTEYFSSFTKNSLGNHSLDLGIFYLFNNNLQFDFAYGQTIHKTTNPFITAGFSIKLDKK
ncbi:MAG: transporter, partial [Flavobacterium sp.]|nr:transporter [Flavobacterium sp.]